MEIFRTMGFEEFRATFGCEKKNGKFVSRNKILKSFLTSDEVSDYCNHNGLSFALETRDMSTLWDRCFTSILETQNRSGDFLFLMGKYYRSNDYRTDYFNGICIDKSYGFIRYVKNDTEKVYKMKAGKMYRHLILNSDFGKCLPEPIILWMCEEFTRKWEAYSMMKVPDFTLHVDDDFYKIYNRYGDCRGDFGSCMAGGDHASFYEDSVKAKAAYLTDNKDGKIIARCIIFTEVTNEATGEILRLAERQYSSGKEEILKRCLIEALIQAGEIDGYKTVGAGCGESRSFVKNDGTSLHNELLSIECTVCGGDILSYQDSFKWYNYGDSIAYNDRHWGADFRLDETDLTFEHGNYDSWHEEYTNNELVTVYYLGERYTCDEYRLDDFCWVESEQEYHYRDDVEYCEYCDEYYLGSGYYSKITGEYYCCEDCRDRAEEDYMESNWYFSDFDCKYFENEEDVTEYREWNEYYKRYFTKRISVESLQKLIDKDDVFLCNGMYYENVA